MFAGDVTALAGAAAAASMPHSSRAVSMVVAGLATHREPMQQLCSPDSALDARSVKAVWCRRQLPVAAWRSARRVMNTRLSLKAFCRRQARQQYFSERPRAGRMAWGSSSGRQRCEQHSGRHVHSLA